MKLVLYGLILFLTIGVTVARETLSRFGMETNYLMIALVALVLTVLLAHRSLMLVLLVLLLCVAINLPPEMIGGITIDQDFLVAVLIAVVILPVVHKLLMR
ncbi:MAG: hypothetical protein Q8L20_04715 [Gammaproteobacteria bacterium]|nr:hypothetical protein [Gammaproteobacteria bacterium]